MGLHQSECIIHPVVKPFTQIMVDKVHKKGLCVLFYLVPAALTVAKKGITSPLPMQQINEHYQLHRGCIFCWIVAIYQNVRAV